MLRNGNGCIFQKYGAWLGRQCAGAPGGASFGKHDYEKWRKFIGYVILSYWLFSTDDVVILLSLTAMLAIRINIDPRLRNETTQPREFYSVLGHWVCSIHSRCRPRCRSVEYKHCSLCIQKQRPHRFLICLPKQNRAAEPLP